MADPLLQLTDSLAVARSLVALWHVGSQFPDQGLNLCPQCCKADSYPLDHQGRPPNSVLLISQFSLSVTFDVLLPHGLQRARFP